MIERLDKVEERYKEIQEKLSTDEVIQDVKKTTELSNFDNGQYGVFGGIR